MSSTLTSPHAPGITRIDGVPVAAVTLREATARILEMSATGTTDILVGVNAHVVNLARHDERLRTFLNTTTFNYADGQSVVWAARSLGTVLPERVATTDLAPAVIDGAAREGAPVFFLGGAPGIAAAAANRMRERTPEVALDAAHGFFDARETDRVLGEIHDHGTRILFVGLGDPLQERWIERHRASLPPVVLTCGGLFDWLSGAHRRAPKVMQQGGLEWLWRLAIEPRRLAHRYLVGNPAFVAAVMRQRAAGRVSGAKRRFA